MSSENSTLKNLNKNEYLDCKWHFSQVKGSLNESETVENADIISAVEFNHDGELLATGDKGGRIVIFNRDRTTNALGPEWLAEYSVYTTFQSHELEFDCLKSLDIDEKINCIRWLKPVNSSKFLLATNDKTIKLWKLSEKDYQVEGGWNCSAQCHSNYESVDCETFLSGRINRTSEKILSVPKAIKCSPVIDSYCKRVYTNAHTYHLNSLSVSIDGQSFLSSDDLRINLWNLERNDHSFNIVDIKPINMEELSEVITATQCSPSDSSQFLYASSRGVIRLCDMRIKSLCDHPLRIFEHSNTNLNNRGFFSEIISSFGDVKYNHSGRYLMARDYLSIKIWDINMNRGPVEIYNIHEHLKSSLCSLYENDNIFDKFQCSWNSDSKNIVTGSYGNLFKIVNRSQISQKNSSNNEEQGFYLEAGCDPITLTNRSKKPLRPFIIHSDNPKTNSVGSSLTSASEFIQQQQPTILASPKRKKDENFSEENHNQPEELKSDQTFGCGSPTNNFPLNKLSKSNNSTISNQINYNKKILHVVFHPNQQIIALAATANLYIFAEKSSISYS